MTFGSLFTGIGGLDLGLERAGMECRWQVEIDDYCTKILEKHWPEVKRYGDIRKVAGSELEPVDLICGGFPCQDVSNTGQRTGIRGTRSGLWTEYIRLVRILRPSFVLVENVPGLLVRGMGQVLGDLAASGYDTEWDCIPAAAFGAPHLRYRIFLVAYSQKFTKREPATQAHTVPANCQTWNESRDCGEHVAHADGSGLAQRQKPELLAQCTAPERSDWWTAEPDVGRVAHGVPSRVDRLKALGNAVVPQVAEWIGRRILEVA